MFCCEALCHPYQVFKDKILSSWFTWGDSSSNSSSYSSSVITDSAIFHAQQCPCLDDSRHAHWGQGPNLALATNGVRIHSTDLRGDFSNLLFLLWSIPHNWLIKYSLYTDSVLFCSLCVLPNKDRGCSTNIYELISN